VPFVTRLPFPTKIWRTVTDMGILWGFCNIYSISIGSHGSVLKNFQAVLVHLEQAG